MANTTYPNDGDQLQRMEIRLRAIEEWMHAQTIENARQEESRKADQAEFGRLHKRLDHIDSNLSRVVWLVLGAIISGFLAFAITGGLAGAV